MSAGQPKVGKLLSNFWDELKRYLQAPDHGELDALRMTLIIGLHGGHKGCLATGPAAALGATSLSAQIGAYSTQLGRR